jgi:undecaprenyl-diphosphatase
LMTGLPLTIAMIVGISRVCMGVHFPSDVMGGWTGGLLWTWVAFVIRGRLIGAREIDQGAVE